MIREILIYICTFICILSAGVVYWGMKSNLKILSEIKKVLGEWAEGGADVCEWKKESDGPSLIYKASCSHSYGIWDWKNLEKCPACGKPIHISEGGGDE